jgi:protein SCO1/2
MRLTRRAGLGLAALGPVAGVVVATRREPPPRRLVQRAGGFGEGYFANVLLQTHEGDQVRFFDDLLRDRTVIINMISTNCPDGLCPLITSNLAALQRQLGDRIGRDIFMYSITLTPLEDTPRELLRYAIRQHVGPGWLFLTGDQADIEILRRKLGFADIDPVLDADPQQHSGVVRYGNVALERWGMVAGMANPKFMASLIESAI